MQDHLASDEWHTVDRLERDREEPEGCTPPHGRPGPLPEDGFTDESPAPQPLKLTTPYPQKAEQVRHTRGQVREPSSCVGIHAPQIPPSALAPFLC